VPFRQSFVYRNGSPAVPELDVAVFVESSFGFMDGVFGAAF
jgi:hypothetical protein